MQYIREEAVFVADAHYPHHGDDFLRLLDALEDRKEQVPQLFLMGDIFDLLFGYNDYIATFASEAIDRLRRLSETIESYYFEGNHDFCLSSVFPEMTVFSYGRQPQRFRLDDKTVGLAHGDRFDVSVGYRLYTAWLRNRMTLTLLRPWERRIIDDRMRKLSQKSICKAYDGFDAKVGRIVQNYRDVDMIVEGHFHQGKRIGRYVSLPSLACQKQIGVARDGGIVFETLERWLTSPSL